MSKATSKTETRNRRSQKRAAGCAPPACSVILGEKIARDIFATGSGPEPCNRIQFMAGDYNTKERGQGGFCESALAKAITESLRVHMGA